MLCCESTTDERSAGNPHATFCGSRGLGPRRPGRTGNVTGVKYGDTRRRKCEQTGNTNLNLTQTRQSPTPLKTMKVHDVELNHFNFSRFASNCYVMDRLRRFQEIPNNE